jgi:hypothetical protein
MRRGDEPADKSLIRTHVFQKTRKQRSDTDFESKYTKEYRWGYLS